VKDEGQPLTVACDARGVAVVTMNRPQRHNALSGQLIDALDAALERLGRDPVVRMVVLTGAGPTFCAGADIGEMRAAADAPLQDNERAAARLAALLGRLDTLPRPTLARVQGDAFGGALGIIAACDVVLAAQTALFALSEVRLGIVPAMISPFLLRAIGERQLRRYALTGERFDASTAERIGLVHQAVPAERLEAAVSAVAAELLRGAPGAQAEVKRLVRHVSGRSEAADAALAGETAAWVARLRAGGEGREGLAAFLGKRAPAWRGD
jgi:methylglutaconyl-CoA hydratase